MGLGLGLDLTEKDLEEKWFLDLKGSCSRFLGGAVFTVMRQIHLYISVNPSWDRMALRVSTM